MSNRPIDYINPAVVSACEQYAAMANDMLNLMVDACRQDIANRPKTHGQSVDSDDSMFATACAMYTLSRLEPHQLEILCATAVYRLARQPASGDPLEQLLK